MKTINLIWIPNISQITSDIIPIYRADPDHIQAIVDMINNNPNDEINIPLYMDENAKKESRLAFMLTITDCFPDAVSDNSFIKQYFILPFNKMIKISDFDKLLGSVDYIINSTIDNISQDITKAKDDWFNKQNRLAYIAKDLDNNIKEALCLLTDIGFLYYAIKKYMNDNEDDIQDSFNSAIKETREEAIAEEEIETEIDMVNSCFKRILKDKDEFESEEFVRCIYNGQEISQTDMIEELSSHYLPEYMPKVKNINDTLDDSYEIETTHLILVRESGGKLNVKRKH